MNPIADIAGQWIADNPADFLLMFAAFGMVICALFAEINRKVTNWWRQL